MEGDILRLNHRQMKSSANRKLPLRSLSPPLPPNGARRDPVRITVLYSSSNSTV